jgi:signal transduction histidine kinase
LSIRGRLLAAVLAAQILLTTGLVVVSVVLTKRQLQSAFDAGLQSRAMSVAALVRYSEDAKPTLVFDREMVPPPLDREHADLYRILDRNGKAIAVSSNWPSGLNLAPVDSREYWDLKLKGREYRAVRLANLPVLDQEGTTTATDATLTVFYAAQTEELNEAVWRAGVLTGLASLVLLGITLSIAVWAIGRGLSPLAALASSARAVSPSNWELQVPPESLETAELAPLTQAMKAMLASLQQAFTSQRAFLADAAHELKTPVAVLKSTLQSLLQRSRSSEEYRSGIEAALEDTTRLEKLVHSMLRLARAEQWTSGNLKRDMEEVDLTSTCELAVAHLSSLAEAHQVKLELCTDGVPRLRADAEDLELVWANLLENAIHYSPVQGTVRLAISRIGVYAEVAVQDQGPGIPEEEVSRVFDRFHRADTSRARSTGGYGLGLAISKAIVQAYGGTIAVRTAAGTGTTMVVRLPVTA